MVEYRASCSAFSIGAISRSSCPRHLALRERMKVRNMARATTVLMLFMMLSQNRITKHERNSKFKSMLWLMGYMCIYHFRDGGRGSWRKWEEKQRRVKVKTEWSGYLEEYPNTGPYRKLLLFWKNTGCSMKKERTRSWIYAQTW